MKILIFGDIHGYAGNTDRFTIDIVVDVVDKTDAELVLQVGDMCSYRDFGKPVYWIYGNNDSLSMMKANREGKITKKNLNHIRTGEVFTLTNSDESIRISGLNGAYEPAYFNYNRDEFDDEGYFTESDVEKCLGLSDIDIFLAHGSPSGLNLGREPDHATPEIRKILEYVKPRYMFCGHSHIYREAEYEGSRIYSLNQANKEYYILDTKTDSFSIVKVNPV